MKNDILDSFTTLHPDLDRWRLQTEAELVALLARHNIAVQLVSSRTKDLESLRKKLARPDKIYARLTDITDLVGIRVATCFEDAIDDVARVIEQAWRVDFTHSTDKLRFVDHRFGYRSLHYVCAPHDDAGLPGVLDGFRFEIQIRTVLQHAWAEVEHDLGYKASTAVPELIRRRFSRIASLLEIADQEFVSIRNDLVLYEQQVREALEHPDRAADVDIVSLRAVVRTDLVDTLDRALSRALDKPMGKAPWNPDYLTRLLRLAGLTTTREVLDAVDRHTACALQLVAPYFEFAQARWGDDAPSFDVVQPGYGLFFVAHVALLQGPALGLSKVERLAHAYQQLDHRNDPQLARQVASGLASALGPIVDAA